MVKKSFFKTNLPVFFLICLIAIPAWFLGKLVPIIGGPVFGILLGMTIAPTKRAEPFETGIAFTSKKILQLAIILLGFEMNLYSTLKVGAQSLSLMLFTLSAAFIVAWLTGRYLKIEGNVSTLIGVGTAICGGSAIAATAPVIKASDRDVAYSISTIFLFNIAAVFIFPAVGHLIGMNDTSFGLWAGTAINDTSSVVAAGYSFSPAAGKLATIVKLTRTLMIIPITLFLSVYHSRRKVASSDFHFSKIFPWFVLGFLGTTILNTTGLVPQSIAQILAQTGKFFIVAAMTAIGLNTHLPQLIKNGAKPILLGLLCWMAVAFTSLLVQGYIRF